MVTEATLDLEFLTDSKLQEWNDAVKSIARRSNQERFNRKSLQQVYDTGRYNAGRDTGSVRARHLNIGHGELTLFRAEWLPLREDCGDHAAPRAPQAAFRLVRRR
jgi:hypothetical protein